MVALPNNSTFDPNSVPPDERVFEPVPQGKYKLQVVDSKIDDTSTGSGQMLTLTLEVVEGPFERRKLWDRLNIVNQNPEAQRIAQQSLRGLCLSIGLNDLKDTEQLHFKPFYAQVTVQQDKSGQYGPQNRVRYMDPSAASGKPPAGKPAPTAARGSAAPNGNPAAAQKPWAQPRASAPDPKMNDDVPF